jgi:hypothetical protein
LIFEPQNGFKPGWAVCEARAPNLSDRAADGGFTKEIGGISFRAASHPPRRPLLRG